MLAQGWRAALHQSIFEQSYGSAAVLAASNDRSLHELKDIVAPWSLLRAARERGGASCDAKLAAAAVDELVAARGFEAGEPGAEIAVRATDPNSQVLFSPTAAAEEQDDVERFKEAFDMQRQQRKQRR